MSTCQGNLIACFPFFIVISVVSTATPACRFVLLAGITPVTRGASWKRWCARHTHRGVMCVSGITGSNASGRLRLIINTPVGGIAGTRCAGKLSGLSAKSITVRLKNGIQQQGLCNYLYIKENINWHVTCIKKPGSGDWLSRSHRRKHLALELQTRR
jgi:hypothetical protein